MSYGGSRKRCVFLFFIWKQKSAPSASGRLPNIFLVVGLRKELCLTDDRGRGHPSCDPCASGFLPHPTSVDRVPSNTAGLQPTRAGRVQPACSPIRAFSLPRAGCGRPCQFVPGNRPPARRVLRQIEPSPPRVFPFPKSSLSLPDSF